jgi:hypothetical protein
VGSWFVEGCAWVVSVVAGGLLLGVGVSYMSGKGWCAFQTSMVGSLPCGVCCARRGGMVPKTLAYM